MKQIELLAPAKDLECGIAAINCGADAVYIGASKFGARSLVGNSLEDIQKLIAYAHKYWAKVYVTVNTILRDEEIPLARKLIEELYQLGADAIIIQDMGLLELDLPPIPLFASTQTHNSTWQKVDFLEKIGFDRVILARELSLEQIKEIKSRTDIELECFIHGALCVSYSGQCYMSYALGGRSGNRGECAQPCRKQYSLKDDSGNFIAKDKYLLSLKDLNLSESVRELINAGVTSFKIEGRLKDSRYVKNIVSFYRQKIDAVLLETGLKKSSSGKSIISFTPDPYKSFNRGFTDYFLHGRKKDITSFDTPKSLGEKIGKVISTDKNSFIIDSKIKLNNGDGICFFDKDSILQGTNINKVEKNRIYPNNMSLITKNTFIYRNHDHGFAVMLDSDEIERKISVNFKLYEEDKKLFIKITDENKVEVVKELEISREIARDKKMAVDNINKQLAKLGGTEFVCNIVEVETPYFIPIKTLNEIRRAVIEELRVKRLENYPRRLNKIEKNSYAYLEKKLTYLANVLNECSKTFYSRHGAQEIQPAAESGINMKGKKVMTTKHCLKYQFGLCQKHGAKKGAPKTLYLVDIQNKNYELNFNCKDCEMEIIF